MIKILQRKFVTTAMLVVSVLLIILLGVINVANIVITQNNVDNRLNMIVDSQTGVRHFEKDSIRSDMPPRMLDKKGNKDRLLASNYFVVILDSDNKVAEVDVTRTSQISEDDATEYALEAVSEGSVEGRKNHFQYQIRALPDDGGYIAVFLDKSDELLSCLRVLALSAAAGLICWIFMLLLAVFLSKKAIRPIAENIEKQRQFITNAGHEIKTPLAIIQANTDALELHVGGNKWISNIQEQVIRMSGLTNNLLMLAKTDEGLDTVKAAEFMLDDVVRTGIANYTEQIEQKKIELTVNIGERMLVKANEDQILQLITILLDNAVKYCNEGGEIDIGLAGNGRSILTIENTCSKLPDCEPEKLFDRFYRDDKARTQKIGGYGIGLSIAKSVAAGNNGIIRCEYRKDNRIAFIVTL